MKHSLRAIVEFAENNCTIYLPEVDGIYGIGDTVDEAKKSLQESISLTIESCIEFGEHIPKALEEDYEIKYSYDLRSFLNIYGSVLSKSGLERITGINQKQLWHYAAGKIKPRKETITRISESVHKFAEALAEVEFA